MESRASALAAERYETARRVAERAVTHATPNAFDPAAALARIRRARTPRSTFQRWRWVLEPIAADGPYNSRWRVAALADCAELACYAGGLAGLCVAFEELFGDDWASAALVLDGIHGEVDARLSELAALEVRTAPVGLDDRWLLAA